MKYLVYILAGCILAGCGSKEAEEVDYETNECKKWPAFAARLGYPAGTGAFTTSERDKMGLLLKKAGDSGKPAFYQHPSWKKAGWLAPIQLDKFGNVFTAPAPLVNVLNNAADSQNIVYKVDAQSGEMTSFVQLDKPALTANQNPYGIMALCYLCDKELLYAATVAGSTRTKEAGGIYCINAASGKIVDQLMGFDPFGIGISYVEGKRKLYFGKARTSEIYSVNLTASGKFSGKPELRLTLDGLGPRGDDKAKRIRFSPKGDMTVEGFEFNFNLIAPAEKQVTNYYFRYGTNTEKWVPIDGSQVR